MSSPPPTTAQLRHDIDTGRTGEKVAAPDPAAAPLGTDDEAAGTPPSGQAVATARDAELKDPARQEAKPDRGGLIFVVAVAVFSLAVIAAGLSTL